MMRGHVAIGVFKYKIGTLMLFSVRGIRGTVVAHWTASERAILRQGHLLTNFISFAQVVSGPV